MSEENVERIRRSHEVLNRREHKSQEIHRVASELLHPDVEWHDQRELPGATVHHGIEAVERHLATAREALDYYPTDLLELIDAGPCVVASYAFTPRPIERRTGRARRLLRLQLPRHKDRARRDLRYQERGHRSRRTAGVVRVSRLTVVL